MTIPIHRDSPVSSTLSRRMRDHRRVRWAITLLLLAACSPGDAPPPAPGGGGARYGGTAVVAIPADFHSLDPLTSERDSEGQIISYLLFTPLVRYDSAFVAQPYLAERWDTARVGRDSLDLTFHLRTDVKWHDGRPTTARDVLFAFQRMTDPRTGFPNLFLLRGYARHAEVLDDSTIRFRLRPFPEYLEIWSRVGGLPEHLLKDVPPEREAQSPYGQHPVGNGPFRFGPRQPGQSFTLEANPAFPRALGGRPYLDRLVHRVIPDATTAFAELSTGNTDVMASVTPALADQVRATPGLVLLQFRTATWVYVSWNTRLPVFASPLVRRALTMALDRRALVQGVVHGYGVEGRATVTPAHWAFDARDPDTALPYDPQGAARLLDQAGWTDRDGSGIRSDAAGHPLRFTVECPTHSTWCDVAQAAQAQWRRVGVDAEVREAEINTMLAEMGHGGSRARDYQAAIMNNTDNVGKTDEAIFGSGAQEEMYAETGYHSPTLDSLFAALDRTTSREAARPLWVRYQEEIARAAPVTVLYYPTRVAGVSGRLRGVAMDARGFYVSATRWWIPPELRH